MFHQTVIVICGLALSNDHPIFFHWSRSLPTKGDNVVPEPTGEVQAGHGRAEEGGGKTRWKKRICSVPPIFPTSSIRWQQSEREFQRSHQRIPFPTLLTPLPPLIRPPSPSYTLPPISHPLVRRSTGDLSTNESAGFGLMSAAANQKRGLNVISGASTNRSARLERLTNRRLGDWGR